MAKTITVIPSTINPLTRLARTDIRKRRTAGYARVSTDSDEQFTSYEAQIDYYTKYITSHQDWEFVKVYTDEGITGTSTKRRTGFNEMIEDALAGKIDLIVTKSVSRFARNTVDSLVTIRKLKEVGCECFFEKEGIYTFDSKGELLLTIMSSLAQEESRSISENVTWGQRKRFSDGKVSLPYHVQSLLSLASVCIFASTILLFVTYSHQLKATSQSLQMKSELTRLQTEQSYYQILEQQNQQLMMYAHDAKKHLAAIQALNDDPQIGSYVTALSQQLADYSRNCHSGNKLLDVIIHKYVVDCKMRGIQFEYDVKVCSLSQLEDIDLVAILGNLMDNAVAAAEDSSEKTVSLNTVHRNSYSVIILTNSCDTPPKQSGNRLLSTKSDTQAHGFGLKSVKKTIQKYQGDYEWSYDVDAKQFTMTVMVADKEMKR